MSRRKMNGMDPFWAVNRRGQNARYLIQGSLWWCIGRSKLIQALVKGTYIVGEEAGKSRGIQKLGFIRYHRSTLLQHYLGINIQGSLAETNIKKYTPLRCNICFMWLSTTHILISFTIQQVMSTLAVCLKFPQLSKTHPNTVPICRCHKLISSSVVI